MSCAVAFGCRTPRCTQNINGDIRAFPKLADVPIVAPGDAGFLDTRSTEAGSPVPVEFLSHNDRGAGKLINFFNPQDFALANWQYNNTVKPFLPGYPVVGTVHSTLYGWNATSGFYRKDGETGPEVALSFPDNAYEMLAYTAVSLSPAVGATSVGGPFTRAAEVDLNAPDLAFGGGEWDSHSAQFLSTNMKRAGYWNKLLVAFGLK